MTFGLQTYDAAGVLGVSLTDKITRVIYTTILSAASSGTLTIPGFDASLGVAVTISMSTDVRKAAHQIKQVGSTVQYKASLINELPTAANPADVMQTDSLLMVFMYG